MAEERDFLAFGEHGPGDAVRPLQIPAGHAWSKTYEANPVMIFRLSAVRFNGHRIHHDREYPTQAEGHAGIVVPVTLVTYLMMQPCRGARSCAEPFLVSVQAGP